MDWIYEGMITAFRQIGIFASLLLMIAAGMWGCMYIGINPAWGMLLFYISVIISGNLFLSWNSKPKLLEASE